MLSLILIFFAVVLTLFATLEWANTADGFVFKLSSRQQKKVTSNLVMSSEAIGKNAALLRTEEWARERGMEPGFGGYWPGDPNAVKYNVRFVSRTTGEEIISVDVPEDRYIFFYIEEQGIDIPIVNKQRMCRQGCCTVCTALVLEGKVKMDAPLGLLRDMRKQGYILTCTSMPRSDLVIEMQDEDEMYVKQWGEHFEGGGVEWGGVLPEDD